MLRQLREDARDYPATMILCGLWVLVFLLMVLNQGLIVRNLTPGEFMLGLRGGHRFGDLTIRELFQGEVWRTVTATFVHYGLLHLGMNLYALYHLGCLVESWYGTGFFVGVYVLTGGIGNLLSALLRAGLGWDHSITSGGGSVVVMGLVGLCAVVGWRAGTRLGDYLRNQMLWVLVLTAAIGLILPLFGLPIIDNWGHACGALVGAWIGLADRWMAARSAGALARWTGRLGGALLVSCAVAQVADDRAESTERREAVQAALKRWADDERYYLRLEEVRKLYGVVTLPRVVLRGMIARAVPKDQPVPSPAGPDLASRDPNSDPDRELYEAVLKAAVKALDSMREALDTGQNAADYRRARELLQGALRDPPALEEFRDFDLRMQSLQQRVRADLEAARVLSITKAIGR